MNGHYSVAQCMPNMQGMHVPSSLQTPAVFTQNTLVPPTWAISLTQEVKLIKAALPKINQIEQAIKLIQLKITEVETKVSDLETRANETEQSLTLIKDEHNTQKEDLRKSQKDINKLQ